MKTRIRMVSMMVLALAWGTAARADGWSKGDVTLAATVASATAGDGRSNGGSIPGTGGTSMGFVTTDASSAEAGSINAATYSIQDFKYQCTYTKTGSPMDYTCTVSFQCWAWAKAQGGLMNSVGSGFGESKTNSATTGFTDSGDNSATMSKNQGSTPNEDSQTKFGSGSGSLNTTTTVYVECYARTIAYSDGPVGNGQGGAYGNGSYPTP